MKTAIVVDAVVGGVAGGCRGGDDAGWLVEIAKLLLIGSGWHGGQRRRLRLT